ncbi:permease [Halobacillus litoralis]|uniref:permease n=1 Tax=Halobacillus litoralis TaxID=45668 RepID=UPI001CD2B14D|nr:permease [Halobacillus litoralis]MCA0970245.1 permease [Halobacillus litoralis]
MRKDYYPKAFIGAGVVLGLQFLFILTISLLAKDGIPLYALPLLSLAVIAFCMSHLYPQFKQKDERMKLIRYKGLFVSFFVILGLMSVLLLLLQVNVVSLTAVEVIQILIALYMTVVFSSWVIVSKTT